MVEVVGEVGCSAVAPGGMGLAASRVATPTASQITAHGRDAWVLLAEHKRIEKEESLRQAFMSLVNVFAYSTWDSSASGVARDRGLSSRVHEHGVRAFRRKSP